MTTQQIYKLRARLAQCVIAMETMACRYDDASAGVDNVMDLFWADGSHHQLRPAYQQEAAVDRFVTSWLANSLNIET